MTYELSSIKSEILRSKRVNGDLRNITRVKEFSFHIWPTNCQRPTNKPSARLTYPLPKVSLQQLKPQIYEAWFHVENHHEDARTESLAEGVNPRLQDVADFSSYSILKQF